MLEIIIKVITNREVVIASVFFLIIIYILFPTPVIRIKTGLRKRKPKREKRKSKKNLEEKKAIKKEIDEPGKLYVPDSTYEILKNRSKK